MKIVADENIPLIEEFFGRLGEVIRLPGRQMTAADVQDADALIVRSVTPVNKALLAGSKVKFVGTCTIGVDHLDQSYFAERDIAWSSAPGCNANSVVEYVYSALTQLDINWLEHKVGIIGCGNVGGLLYRRLRAQGVECVCYDPHKTRAEIADLGTLDEVLACDLISMHTPLELTGSHPSFHLLGLKELRQLKPNAVLINCGRGAVIDNQALLQVLNERADLQVILDVWEPEPAISLELLDKVKIGTPHIAGYSYDGKLKGTEMIYQAFCRHFGIEPKASLAELVPPLADNHLNVARVRDSWLDATSLIQQVYRVAQDDANLRALAQEAIQQGANFALGFDGLRKHYAVRREFHNYEVPLAGATEQEKNWLAALGFRCV